MTRKEKTWTVVILAIGWAAMCLFRDAQYGQAFFLGSALVGYGFGRVVMMDEFEEDEEEETQS